MTNAYLRIQRNGKWEEVMVEFMTDQERKDTFESRTPEELVRWLNLVCNTLKELAQ